MLSMCINWSLWFTEIMCLRNTPCVEDIIYELEAEHAADEDYISEEEEEDQVDPAYIEYLAATHQELMDLVDAAGGELNMTVYSRFLFDELYIGQNVSPFYYQLGLEIIYEE